MAQRKFSDTIDRLFQRCEWEKARKLLETQRAKQPENHWLLTQLGVTFYEQRKYTHALQLLLASLKIMDDCPLTLWNLAGTLDALGKHAEAVKIYTWLLESERSPKDHPCWESKQWADALRTDCVYRLGASFENLGKKKAADQWYRKYLDLLVIGADGTYSIEDVTRRIRGLRGPARHVSDGGAVRKALSSALPAPGTGRKKNQPRTPPRFDERGLLIGRRAAGKA
ncbi:MAG TPA: hypothetical protein VMV69_26690 [Pirellulales bacterium]|nr:hypothetical protein [Pirellulales bacterium]